ncbi:hypothetical protein ISTM_432 [Insectomime virus]|nr:hypothetical protein ISTM_432 [Insectomime virus]
METMISSRQWPTMREEMSAEEREKAVKYAKEIITKIKARLEADIYFGVYPGFSSVNAVCGTGGKGDVRELFRVEAGNVLKYNNQAMAFDWEDGKEPAVTEEEVIEDCLLMILGSKGYLSLLTVKKLDKLNENFSRLFSFLRESVELVPGSEKVESISRDFVEKSLQK